MIFWLLFFSFFKIGLFSIGGGYAMVPYITQVVTGQGWLTVAELADVLALAEMTPGPYAINCSTFVGMRMAGLLGAAVATIGVSTPSVLLSMLAAKYFYSFREKKAVQGVMSAFRPLVAALVAAAAITIGRTTFFSNGIDYAAIGITLVALVVTSRVKVHPILLIFIGAVVGILVYAVLPPLF